MSKYLPIPHNHIRLIQLDPSSTGSELCGTLAVVPLTSLTPNQTRPYAALSYTWGENDDSGHEVSLNGWPTPIRRNLWLFLSQYQNCRTPLHLWVDALCINQEDKAERSTQVAMMSKIYKFAEVVIVWLGPARGNSDLVMDMLATPFGSIPDKSMSAANGLAQALNAWLSREYWSRTWILQEFLLARKLIIMCGMKSVAGTQVETFASGKMKVAPDIETSGFAGTPGLTVVAQRSKRKTASSLLELVLDNSSSLCTNPRDRVFAMLGLASECLSGQTFSVDYSMALEHLVGEVLQFCGVPEKNMCQFAHRLSAVLGINKQDNVINNAKTTNAEHWSVYRTATSGLLSSLARRNISTLAIQGFVVGRLRDLSNISQSQSQSQSWPPDPATVLSLLKAAIGTRPLPLVRQSAMSANSLSISNVPPFSECLDNEDLAKLIRTSSLLRSVNQRSSQSLNMVTNTKDPVFGSATIFLSGRTSQSLTEALTFGHCGKGDLIVQFPGLDVGLVMSPRDPRCFTGTIIHSQQPERFIHAPRAKPYFKHGYISSPADLRTPVTVVKLRMTSEELVSFAR